MPLRDVYKCTEYEQEVVQELLSKGTEYVQDLFEFVCGAHLRERRADLVDADALMCDVKMICLCSYAVLTLGTVMVTALR